MNDVIVAEGYPDGGGVRVVDAHAWKDLHLPADTGLLKNLVLAYYDTLLDDPGVLRNELFCHECGEGFVWPHGTPKVCPNCRSVTPEAHP